MRTNRHFKFQDLNIDQLWHLREQIVLNSIFFSDFRNDFEFEPESISDFFDGYLDYLFELASADGIYEPEVEDVVETYDNPDTLFDYYWNMDAESLCSVRYDPEWDDEDNQVYEDYWNGIDPDGYDPDCR